MMSKYSGNSSRNNTPLLVSEISPGCGNVPPPTRPASVTPLRIVQKSLPEYHIILSLITNTSCTDKEISVMMLSV